MKKNDVLEAIGIGVMLASTTVIEITLIPFVAGVIVATIGLGGEAHEKKESARIDCERRHRQRMRIDWRVGE